VIAPTLETLTNRLEALADFSKTALEEAFKQLIQDEGMKMGQLAQPVRVALTGRSASPGIFEVMDLLGRERTIGRLRQGIARAANPSA